MSVSLRAVGWIKEVPVGDRLSLPIPSGGMHKVGTGRVRLAYRHWAGRATQSMREILLQIRCRCSKRGFADARFGCGSWVVREEDRSVRSRGPKERNLITPAACR